MRLTSMFRYGMRALAVLAENYKKRPVSAKEISQREEISLSFLEQLLAKLRKHGIIRGSRGPGGGFVLTRPPSKIRVSDVVEALEGPVFLSKCLGAVDLKGDDPCGKIEDCPVYPLLKKIEKDFRKVLSSYDLSEIVSNKRKNKRKRG